MRRGALLRGVHRLHRGLGSALALLVAVWFGSGAVMTFAVYPRYSDAERLAHAPPLAAGLDNRVPAELSQWVERGGLARGARARLSVLEARATWTYDDGERRAHHAVPLTAAVEPLDAARAQLEIERRFARKARAVEWVERADQWTVGRVPAPLYPLFRVALDDDAHTEVYVSARSGEVVQASTRSERVWCWLGAIPHWIYPAILRREREVWRTTVLVLSGLGLAASLSGLIAGLHVAWLTRRRAGSPARNVYLRWHQRIGLAFGLLASTWLFSGALSLDPFHWSGPDPSQAQLSRIYGKSAAAASDIDRVPLALARCREQLELREAELAAFGGRAVVLCSDGAGRRLVVDLADGSLEPTPQLAAARIQAIAASFGATATWHDEPDDFYYPTHANPDIALPFVRLALPDDARTAFYLDPAGGRLVRHTTTKKRLERWLYNGLHSFDFPVLYQHPLSWRVMMITAMLVGLLLSALGFTLYVSRARKRHLTEYGSKRL